LARKSVYCCTAQHTRLPSVWLFSFSSWIAAFLSLRCLKGFFLHREGRSSGYVEGAEQNIRLVEASKHSRCGWSVEMSPFWLVCGGGGLKACSRSLSSLMCSIWTTEFMRERERERERECLLDKLAITRTYSRRQRGKCNILSYRLN